MKKKISILMTVALIVLLSLGFFSLSKKNNYSEEVLTPMDHSKMNLTSYLEVLKDEMHSTVISTVNNDGKPGSRVIDMMLVKENKLYFLTANTKAFYQQLIEKPYVSITGVKGEDTMSSLAITVDGQVRAIGTKYLEEIFAENPYMNEIYTSEESKKVLRVFEVFTGKVSVFDLSQKPIFQKTLQF